MKSEKEIRERIEEEMRLLAGANGHLASIARGWLDALEWVLERTTEGQLSEVSRGERAEEILLKGECGKTTWSYEYRTELKGFIAAQLREVEREGGIKEQIQHNFYMVAIEQRDKAYAEGFSAARDKAAGIAEEWTIWAPDHIVKLIERILAMEIDK